MPLGYSYNIVDEDDVYVAADVGGSSGFAGGLVGQGYSMVEGLKMEEPGTDNYVEKIREVSSYSAVHRQAK